MADIFQSIAILCVAITGVALTLYYRGLRDRVDVIQRWMNSVREQSSTLSSYEAPESSPDSKDGTGMDSRSVLSPAVVDGDLYGFCGLMEPDPKPDPFFEGIGGGLKIDGDRI